MRYVYTLNKENQNFYIGYTSDLESRVKRHRELHPGYKLIYYEAYTSEKNARKRERKLKYYGSAWRALKQRI